MTEGTVGGLAGNDWLVKMGGPKEGREFEMAEDPPLVHILLYLIISS